MDIRIEQIDADPPVWKVFLGTYFIVCSNEDEAVACLEAARLYVASHPGMHCFLPHPPVVSPPMGRRPSLRDALPPPEPVAQPDALHDEAR